MNKYQQAIEIIELHFVEHAAVEKSQYELLMSQFPDLITSYTAYRAVICKPLQVVKEVFLKESFRSWSLSMEGISEYVQLEHADMVFEAEDMVHIYEAQVEGLSLVALCKELIKQELMTENQAAKFIRENELLALQVDSFKLTSTRAVSTFLES